MLPNLIDLIIIFEKLGDGDPSAVYSPHDMRAFLLLILFCGGPIRLIIFNYALCP